MLTNLLPMENSHPSLITDGVPEGEQVMPLNNTFWVFLSPNICVTSWLFGILAAQGLNVWTAVGVIVFGILLGSVVPALTACIGPLSHLSQLEASKYAFGRYGVRLPALLNWGTSIGWDAVNNVPAAGALAAFLVYLGLPATYWLALLILVTVQMAVAIYGHHVVHHVAKYIGFLLLLTFAFLGYQAVAAAHGISTGATLPFSWKALALSSSVILLNPMGWAAYTADYTRYLPQNTPPHKVFWRVFLGLSISLIPMGLFGLISASAVTDPSAEGVIAMLRHLSGGMAPLILLIISVSSIPANAINDNSAAYCLVTSGIRILRPLSAAIGAVIGFVLALYGASHILTLVENTLLLMLYWTMVWAGMTIVQYFYQRRLQTLPIGNWLPGATIFCVLTAVTMALFVVNDLYTGPVGAALDGVDIGSYIAFPLAALLYWLTVRKTMRQSALATI